MTIFCRPTLFAALVLVLAGTAYSQPAPISISACAPGDQGCPAQMHMERGATSALVEGRITQARGNYFFSFKARAGQVLTIEAIKDPGIKWGVGQQIWFPGEKEADSDAVIVPGGTLELPRDGIYVVQLFSNHMADNPYGPFVLKVTITTPRSATAELAGAAEDRRFIASLTGLIKGCLMDRKNLQPGTVFDLTKAGFHYRAAPLRPGTDPAPLHAGVIEVDAPTQRKGANWVKGVNFFTVTEQDEIELKAVWDGAHGGFQGDPVISREWDCRYDPRGEGAE